MAYVIILRAIKCTKKIIQLTCGYKHDRLCFRVLLISVQGTILIPFVVCCISHESLWSTLNVVIV